LARFKLTIEYDGSAYKGWQKNSGQLTIQGKIIETCEAVFNTDQIELIGAGRTDAGVHALGQTAHLEVDTAFTAAQVLEKINDKLPSNVHILTAETCDSRFHARHHAEVRSYLYLITLRRSAFFKKNTWWVKDPINLEAIQKASLLFPGFHDFASFGRIRKKEESTQVKIEHIGVHKKDQIIGIHITGSHFLWHQVRRMTGVLVEIGKGNLRPEKITEFFNTTSDIPAKYTAPASGLYLEHVYYKGEPVNLKPKWPVLVYE